MISDAAATIIQKIADSNTAMAFTIEDYIYCNSVDYANYRSFLYTPFLIP